MTETKQFPITVERGAKPHPLRIPWHMAELAYSVYAGRYGRNQSLERMAERGGFYPSEMDEYLPDWRERCDRLDELNAEIDRLKIENARLHEAIETARKRSRDQTIESMRQTAVNCGASSSCAVSHWFKTSAEQEDNCE